MKHLNKINTEFAKIALDKQAATFEDLSYEAQKEYLKQHPASKKKVTKSPGDSGEPLSALREDIESKRKEIKSGHSPEELEEAISYLKDAKIDDLIKAFANSGYEEDPKNYESMEFDSFRVKNGLEAAYNVEFVGDDGKLWETTNFISWDGKEYKGEFSGVSNPVDDIDEDDIIQSMEVDIDPEELIEDLEEFGIKAEVSPDHDDEIVIMKGSDPKALRTWVEDGFAGSTDVDIDDLPGLKKFLEEN